jgi:hypothetical protein
MNEQQGNDAGAVALKERVDKVMIKVSSLASADARARKWKKGVTRVGDMEFSRWIPEHNVANKELQGLLPKNVPLTKKGRRRSRLSATTIQASSSKRRRNEDFDDF